MHCRPPCYFEVQRRGCCTIRIAEVSHRYQDLLRRNAVQISMSRKGQCHDNAPMESFFGTLKTEMHLRGDPFESHDEARRALFEYIEVFYNRQRRHSTLGYQTPAEFEEQYIQQQPNAA